MRGFGWLGRRWARRIGALVARDVDTRVRETLLAPLDDIESARERIAAALRGIDADCA